MQELEERLKELRFQRKEVSRELEDLDTEIGFVKIQIENLKELKREK